MGQYFGDNEITLVQGVDDQGVYGWDCCVNIMEIMMSLISYNDMAHSLHEGIHNIHDLDGKWLY